MSRPPLRSQQSQSESPRDDEPQDAPLTVSEQMAEDSRQVEKPVGSPQVWPYAQLPRRMKADFFAKVRGLDAMREFMGGNTPGEFEQVADWMAFVADAEDAIRVVVHPASKATLDAWLDDVDDQTLINLLMWYLQTFQVGEAKAS